MELIYWEILNGVSVTDNIALSDIDDVGVMNAYNKMLGGSILSVSDKQHLLREVKKSTKSTEEGMDYYFNYMKTIKKKKIWDLAKLNFIVEPDKGFCLSKTTGNIPPPTTCVCFVFSAKEKLDENGPFKLLAKLGIILITSFFNFFSFIAFSNLLAKQDFPRVVVLTHIMDASTDQIEALKSELKLYINPIRIFEIENYVVEKLSGYD